MNLYRSNCNYKRITNNKHKKHIFRCCEYCNVLREFSWSFVSYTRLKSFHAIGIEYALNYDLRIVCTKHVRIQSLHFKHTSRLQESCKSRYVDARTPRLKCICTVACYLVGCVSVCVWVCAHEFCSCTEASSLIGSRNAHQVWWMWMTSIWATKQ